MDNLNAKSKHQKPVSQIPDFMEGVDRDTVAQAYQNIVQFLHRYKNNIEFVTKEELVAVTNIKENIIERVLSKLKKIGVLSTYSDENENSKVSTYVCYYINKDNLENH